MENIGGSFTQQNLGMLMIETHTSSPRQNGCMLGDSSAFGQLEKPNSGATGHIASISPCNSSRKSYLASLEPGGIRTGDSLGIFVPDTLAPIMYSDSNAILESSVDMGSTPRFDHRIDQSTNLSHHQHVTRPYSPQPSSSVDSIVYLCTDTMTHTVSESFLSTARHLGSPNNV